MSHQRPGFSAPRSNTPDLQKSVYALPCGETLDPEWKVTDLIEDYLIRCEIGGYSPKTVELYRDDLTTLSRFLKEHGADKIMAVGHHHIEGFLRAAHERGCKAHSVHRLYRSIKPFFRDLSRLYEGYVAPIEKIRPPKLPTLPPKALTLEQVQALISMCNSLARRGGRRGSTARQDGFFIRFLFDSGLRLTEALSVRLDDIDAATGTVMIQQGKGSKPRSLMVGQHTLLELRRHVRSLREGSSLLFPGKSLKERSMNPSSLRHRLNTLGNRAGFHVSPHRFRHSCARQMCLDGASIPTIQARLGHTNPQMTLHYAKLFCADTLEQGKKFSPGDRL